MVFDILSFIAGIAAGLVAGALGAFLHGLERTADLQEKVRSLTHEVENMRRSLSSDNPDLPGRDVKTKMDELQHDLDEIHEEIRKMYKRGTR